MRTVFIQANNKQLLGARLAEFAIKRNLQSADSVRVQIINVDNMNMFHDFAGKNYMRDNKKDTYRPEDLQSFTLSRFLPPELMNYHGFAVVIDPDIFALTDINELFEMDMQGKTIMACRKKSAWDTSVMLMDCSKLQHWSVPNILHNLIEQKVSYDEIMTLAEEESVAELPRAWNSLDYLGESTKMLHTTNRLTQPWKTGLKIDFTRSRDKDRYLGMIPKPWVLRCLGKYPTRYQPHPDKKIESFFFELLNSAIEHGAINRELIKNELAAKHIRSDIFQYIA